MSTKFNYLLKYVIIGDSGVGKSNILLRFINNTFTEEFRSTVGVEFSAKNIVVNKNIYRVQVWDTAGQETFRSISRAYYKNSVCACVVYDISNYSSFESVQSWIEDCKSQSSKSILIILIGNKSDLNDIREVTYDEGAQFAKSNNMIFLETSAKTGDNIEEIFDKSVRKIDQNIIDNKYDLENESCGIRVGEKRNSFSLKGDNIVNSKKKKKKKKCC